VKYLFVAAFVSTLAISAYASNDVDCGTFAGKFVEYAKVRDSGVSLKDARKMAIDKEGPNGAFLIEGVYQNGEMKHMTPEQIRATVIKSCGGGKVH
jgi:hypothetical protein